MEKILKIENLQLVIEKKAKLVQNRSELERFQAPSNDFNRSTRLNDSDGIDKVWQEYILHGINRQVLSLLK